LFSPFPGGFDFVERRAELRNLFSPWSWWESKPFPPDPKYFQADQLARSYSVPRPRVQLRAGSATLVSKDTSGQASGHEAETQTCFTLTRDRSFSGKMNSGVGARWPESYGTHKKFMIRAATRWRRGSFGPFGDSCRL
jgi:hypothetical protein